MALLGCHGTSVWFTGIESQPVIEMSLPKVNWGCRRDRPARLACPSTHSRAMLLPTDFGEPWTTRCGIEGARTGVPVHGELAVLESFTAVRRDWLATYPEQWMLSGDRPSDQTERLNRTVEANHGRGQGTRSNCWCRLGRYGPAKPSHHCPTSLSNRSAICVLNRTASLRRSASTMTTTTTGSGPA